MRTARSPAMTIMWMTPFVPRGSQDFSPNFVMLYDQSPPVTAMVPPATPELNSSIMTQLRKAAGVKSYSTNQK